MAFTGFSDICNQNPTTILTHTFRHKRRGRQCPKNCGGAQRAGHWRSSDVRGNTTRRRHSSRCGDHLSNTASYHAKKNAHVLQRRIAPCVDYSFGTHEQALQQHVEQHAQLCTTQYNKELRQSATQHCLITCCALCSDVHACCACIPRC